MPIQIGNCQTPAPTPTPPVQEPDPSLPAPPQDPSEPPAVSQPDSANGYNARLLGSLPLAMAYVPMQQWKSTYSLSAALERGTAFPELDLPFEGGTKK